MIGIIDYGMGNLRSVQKAFEAVGAVAQVLDGPDRLDAVDRLVLPGVGAFADGMTHLRQRGWDDAIKAYVASGRPMLGICLGMQLLFDSSQEDAVNPDHPVPGLGLLPGRVVRFTSPAPDGQRLKIPHMGWNQIHWTRQDPLLAGLSPGCEVYFVHGYHVEPADDTLASAVTDYGRRFCATVWREQLWATQFHPEKSQRVGLTMLRNFATRCGQSTPLAEGSAA